MTDLSDPTIHAKRFAEMASTPEYKEAARKVKAERLERMEGRVYAFIILHQYKGEFSVTRWYYTMRDGLIGGLSKGNKFYPSGDDPAEIEMTGYLIGRFDPKKNYEQKCDEMTYAEMKKAFNLKPVGKFFGTEL